MGVVVGIVLAVLVTVCVVAIAGFFVVLSGLAAKTLAERTVDPPDVGDLDGPLSEELDRFLEELLGPRIS